MTFTELELDERIVEAISYMGFETTTPIQEKAIPEILKGKDLIACAQTGTGKTAAFMLPLLHHISRGDHKGTSTLVIVPTRELALQIDQQIQGFAYFVPVSSMAIYGGGNASEWDVQKKGLESHADIIIATPGKLISHINMGNVRFDHLKYLILDEADRMLDMGFYDDIMKILEVIPKKRQTLMFSATMPIKMRELAKKNTIHPVEISIAISKPSEAILQAAYLVNDGHKNQLIKHLIDDKPTLDSIIIFSSTKKDVNTILKTLSSPAIRAEGISSDLDQNQREEVLVRFRSKQTRVIVATDVLARGIDIKDIQLVINYSVPKDAEDYIHRIGRTARASSSGVAITLVNEEDMYAFLMIEKLIGKEIIKLKLPENIGTSPEWNPTKQRKFRGNRPNSNSSDRRKKSFNSRPKKPNQKKN